MPFTYQVMPHAVRNVAFSSSITFNFMLPEQMDMWAMHMERVVQKSDCAEAATGIIDLVIAAAPEQQHESKTGEQEGTVDVVTVRAFVPGPAWEPTGGSRILTDSACRAQLPLIQESIRQSCGMDVLHNVLKTVGSPLAYEVDTRRLVSRHELSFHLSTPASIRELQELFGVELEPGVWLSCRYRVVLDKQFVSQSIFGETFGQCNGTHRFRQRSSHVGTFPDFPPLCVLFNQSWYYESLFSYACLPLVVRARVRDGMEHPGTAQSARPQRTRHYSRFPWREEAPSDVSGLPKPWRSTTYLFYSSPYIDGPVSLHPLRDDATLQSMHAANASRFDLHFEEFQWDLAALLGEGTAVPLSLIDLGDTLYRSITTNVFLPPSSSDDRGQRKKKMARTIATKRSRFRRGCNFRSLCRAMQRFAVRSPL